jgi:hypothetical protein
LVDDVPRRGGRRAIGSIGLIALLPVVSACGGANPPQQHRRTSTGTATSTSAQPARLQDAIVAPHVKLLHRGQSYDVSKSVLNEQGWQVSCASGGQRVNAEQERGQRTNTGKVISDGTTGPSIWVHRNKDGSLTIECR